MCYNLSCKVIFICCCCCIFLFAAKLEMESTVFQGSVVVRLRSVKENSYLCVNLEGNLTVEVGLTL